MKLQGEKTGRKGHLSVATEVLASLLTSLYFRSIYCMPISWAMMVLFSDLWGCSVTVHGWAPQGWRRYIRISQGRTIINVLLVSKRLKHLSLGFLNKHGSVWSGDFDLDVFNEVYMHWIKQLCSPKWNENHQAPWSISSFEISVERNLFNWLECIGIRL